MEEVERLLTAGMVEIAPIDPSHRDAQHCLGRYYEELNRRFRAGFDIGHAIPTGELRPPTGLLLVATLRSEPIGCGALKTPDGAPPEIKRMWVAEPARGIGVGRRLLAELEAHAAGRGSPTIRLETNDSLAEAIAMYRSSGYVEVAPFNDEPYAHHWFEKHLPR